MSRLSAWIILIGACLLIYSLAFTGYVNLAGVILLVLGLVLMT